MLWMTIGGNAIPMGFNQLGKLSIRLQSLPFQAVLPSFKEGAGTALGSVIPELAEGFLEEVGGVQTPVGLEQFFQGSSAIQTQVLASREQGISLALDVTPVLAAEAFEVLIILQFLLVLAVLASAAGNILRDNFGLPYGIGLSIMLVVVGTLTFYGRNVIAKVLTFWSFIFVCGVFYFFYICLQ